MRHIAEVGDEVIVKSFSYINKSGGTGMSNQQMKCRITKAMYDYECGWRYWAEPLEEVDDEQRKQWTGSEGEKYNGSGTIYVSEFEIIG